MAAFTPVGVTAVVDGLGSFLRDMGKMDSSIQDTADRSERSGSRIGKLGGKFASMGKAAAAAAATGIIAVGTAVAAVGVVSLKTAIDFESAWAGVVKTTDGLVDEFGNLTESGEEIQQAFRDMAKEVPLAVEELLEIGELGGQLGVAKDDLVDFTEVIAAMGVSTNLTTEAAATGFAQLANVMGTTEKFGSSAFSRLGSSIVALGNSSATTEADILSFAQRMAGASKVAGVTEADMLGISAAFTSVGIQAQAGGTAVSKVFLSMNKAALEGGDEMEIFAATAGLSADDFGAAWKEDAGAVFGEFVTGLGLAGDDAIAILDALEIKDSQAVRAFLSLAGAGDLVTESMITANEGWEENTALAAEAEQRYQTTAAQFTLVKNSIKDIAITIGQVLLPYLKKAIDAVKPVIDEFGKKLPGALDRISEAMKPVLDAISSFIKFVGDAIKTGDSMNDFLMDVPESIRPFAKAFADTAIDVFDAIDKIASAFSNLFMRIQGRGLQALFTIFEDGSSILSAFFSELGLGEEVAQQIATTVIGVAKAIKSFIDFVKANGNKIVKTLKSIGKGLAIAFAVQKILGPIKLIVAAIGLLTSPIGIVAVAIALLAKAWTSNWGDIQGKTQAVMDELRPTFEAIREWFIALIPQAVQFLSDLWESVLLPAFQAVSEFIQNTLIPAFYDFVNFLMDVVPPIVEEVSAFIVEMFDLVKAWVDENWPLIQETIDTVLTAIQTTVETILTAISEFWTEHGAAIMEQVTTVWNFIKTVIQTTIETVLAIIKAIMQAINGDWDAAWTTIKDAAAAIWDGIKTLISAAINFIKDTVLPAAMSGIEAAWDIAWEAIKDAVNTIWETIKTLVNDAIDAVKAKIIEVLDNLGIEWRDNWDDIKRNLEIAWTAIKDAVGEGADWIKDKVDTAVTFIKDKFGSAMDWIQEKAETVWAAIKTAFDTGVTEAKAVLDAILPSMRAAGEAIVNAIQDGIEAAWSGLTSWFNDRLDDLTGLLPWSEPKDPRSNLRHLSDAGQAIVANIEAGLLDAMPGFQATLNAVVNPTQGPGATTIGGNVTNITNVTQIDVTSNPAGQRSEQAIYWDVSAALAAGRT